MSVRDRLIQLTLRARNFLSGDVQPATDSMRELTEEGRRLKASMEDVGRARGMARTLRDNQQATEGLARAQDDARATLDDLTRELGDNAEATAGQRIAMREARRTLDEAERAYKKNQSAIKNLTTELKQMGVDTDNVADEEKRLAALLDALNKALAANRDAVREKRVEEKKAADTTKEHADRVDSARGALSSGAKQVLAFAAAYISLNAAFGLVQRGLNAVAAGIRSMLSTGDNFELLGKRMASLMGSVAAGEQATAWIKQFARDTPLQVQDVTEAFALLKSYGLDPMDGSLQAVVDKNEQLGGGMERLTGISSALGQAYAKQKLQTEEILQLVERGVPVWSMLEKVTGKNAAQLAELASKGKLGRDVIGALIKEIGASAEGAAAENMGTLTGLVSNLSDTWSDFLDRIAKSGALDYAKQQLAGVAEYIEQMDRDGRLDKLATSLSTAFEQGAEKAKEFLGRLAEVDLNKFIDDSSAWLSDFGSTLDRAAQSAQLFVAPFRTMFNGLTAGLSSVGAAFTGTVGLMLGVVETAADKIPDMLGGEKIRADVKAARETINGLRDGFVAQIEQDGQDIRDAWDTNTKSAVKNAQDQKAAAVSAEQAKLDAAEAAADKVAELNARFAQQAVEASATGQRAVTDMAEALNLIDTAKSVQQLEGLRGALLKAFQDGRVTQEQYAQATGLLNGKLSEIGGTARGAAGGLSDLDEKLGDLTQVQAAISNAKTDVDINAIRAALKKLYGDGSITAAQYNEELKKTSDRQKELKGAVEQGKKAQDEKNDSDKEAIKTSEQLRRESGKRMEEERRASGEAMERNRKDGDDTRRDMSAMEDFFGGVLSRAREPLAALSAAALAAYDRLSGITTVDLSMDTSDLEATTKSLEKARDELGKLQAAANTVGMSSLGRWMTQSQVQSQQIQAQYLEQKLRLQELMAGYEDGSITLENFVRRAGGATNSLTLLDKSDLSNLNSALESAKQRMEQLGDSTRATLESLQMELLQLQGTQEEIERARFDSRRNELRAQQAQAQTTGDSAAVANLARALRTLNEIEDVSTAKRQQAEQQKRAEEVAKAAPVATAPAKVIRLESARGKAVDVAVNSAADETNLLSILEDAGLRSL